MFTNLYLLKSDVCLQMIINFIEVYLNFIAASKTSQKFRYISFKCSAILSNIIY